MSIIIAIEGPDRVGKKTQAAMLVNALKNSGHRVASIEVPIEGNASYRLVYWMLKNGLARRLPNLFQFIQFVNKYLFQATWLRSLSRITDYVVLDRWRLSAIVYGDATGVNRRFNRKLMKMLALPDMTIVLDGVRYTDVAEDVYEADTDLQVKVRRGYADWVCDHHVDHELVDNRGTVDEVHERVMNALGFNILKTVPRYAK